MKRGVYLTQILCPHRHSILAIAFESEGASADLVEKQKELERQFRELVDAGLASPWCRLCRSRELKCETTRSPFRTIEEALPLLRYLEARRAMIRRAWNSARN